MTSLHYCTLPLTVPVVLRSIQVGNIGVLLATVQPVALDACASLYCFPGFRAWILS